MSDWNRAEFGYWLRLQRRVEHQISQERLAELVGTTQAKISRWEAETPNTEAPSLDECVRLSDVFDADFIELARMCGRWNDELERRVVVALDAVGGGNVNAHNPRTVSWVGRPIDTPAAAGSLAA